MHQSQEIKQLFAAYDKWHTEKEEAEENNLIIRYEQNREELWNLISREDADNLLTQQCTIAQFLSGISKLLHKYRRYDLQYELCDKALETVHFEENTYEQQHTLLIRRFSSMYDLDRKEEAEEYFRKLEEDNKNEASVYAMKMEVLKDADRLEEAQEVADEFLKKLASSQFFHHRDLALIIASEIYLAAGNTTKKMHADQLLFQTESNNNEEQERQCYLTMFHHFIVMALDTQSQPVIQHAGKLQEKGYDEEEIIRILTNIMMSYHEERKDEKMDEQLMMLENLSIDSISDDILEAVSKEPLQIHSITAKFHDELDEIYQSSEEEAYAYICENYETVMQYIRLFQEYYNTKTYSSFEIYDSISEGKFYELFVVVIDVLDMNGKYEEALQKIQDMMNMFTYLPADDVYRFTRITLPLYLCFEYDIEKANAYIRQWQMEDEDNYDPVTAKLLIYDRMHDGEEAVRISREMLNQSLREGPDCERMLTLIVEILEKNAENDALEKAIAKLSEYTKTTNG